ncbi:MAG: hypothetical protein PHU44_03085 [Syntrophales bacterium]|nr:hypothetical protein [Syntrophales bacterium]
MSTGQKRNYGGSAAVFLLAVLFLWLSPAYGSGTISENFTNNQFNTSLWTLQSMGQGTTVEVINDRAEVTVAGPGYAGLYGYGFTLIGDFDMRVDFTLINWPTNNGTQIIIYPFNPPQTMQVQVARANVPTDPTQKEQYFSIFSGAYNSTGVTGPTMSGTLRLLRTGNTMEVFYWDGANWQSVGSKTDTSLGGRVGVGMNIGPYANNYSGIPAIAAYDNIQITYTTLGPGFTPTGGPGMFLLLE